jgi:hypothetical protein
MVGEGIIVSVGKGSGLCSQEFVGERCPMRAVFMAFGCFTNFYYNKQLERI